VRSPEPPQPRPSLSFDVPPSEFSTKVPNATSDTFHSVFCQPCRARDSVLERDIRNVSTRPSMASASFRDSINSLGWSRRNADSPVNTAPQGGFLSSLQSLNPFGDRGYVQLPTTEGAGAPLPASTRREEEEGWFACESTLFPCRAAPTTATYSCLISCPRTLFPSLPCRQTYDAGHVPVLHAMF